MDELSALSCCLLRPRLPCPMHAQVLDFEEFQELAGCFDQTDSMLAMVGDLTPADEFQFFTN